MTAGTPLLAQLTRIERGGGDGELLITPRVRLRVSSLDRPYFPEDGITKGDLMRYYVRVAGVMLPQLDRRPLALKRFPAGIHGHSFYQQNVPEHAPEVVRTAEVVVAEETSARRLLGGDLATLLYCVQTGGIAIHSWLSHLPTLEHPDFSLIDLDPGDDTPFASVVALARETRAVLDELELVAAVKTSGSRGMHIAIPLPRRASYERSAELALAVAERVVARCPEIATLERRIARRPPRSVYVDVQQNAMGKSVVAPYAVRARTGATVSAPLHWNEVRATLDMHAFTVQSMPHRLRRRGDPWGEALRRGNAAGVITAALREKKRATTPTTASGARRGSAQGTRGRQGAR